MFYKVIMGRAQRIIIFIAIFFTAFPGFSQGHHGTKTLEELILENRNRLLSEPGKAFYEIDGLLERAIREKDKDAELTLLSRRCWYLTNNDLKRAIDAARKFQSKAEEYKSIHYMATAHVHFSNIYLNSELPAKALDEFDAAMELINKPTYKAERNNASTLRINAYTAAGSAYRN
ncbi:hypothetical protein, partial [uncultured Flavobacterium sp.]|uniref:hypothetical protein n=1 Tax=uncultured Flavobacterium sp. TaxID=165435 RepID=UPI002600108F